MNIEVPSKSPCGILTLLELRGIGLQSVERLTSQFATLAEIREASLRSPTATISAQARASICDTSAWEKAMSRSQEILGQAECHGVDILTTADERYPQWLRIIPDRPPILFLKGTLPVGSRYVACIGTREPSRFGEQVTRRIAAFLAERGWSIVSGLALGVDSLAHQAALDANGHTVAILANGLEAIYPKKNAGLAANILTAGGALLSEQPFGTPAIPRNLVQRDRLQSGMSAGTIVMQTDVVGGSMHTVRFTLMQGRLLFAPTPHGPHMHEPKSQGLLAMTRMSGQELARTLGANGDYARLLEGTFGTQPVAIPISGREDYEKLVQLLERTTPNDVKLPTGHRDPQLNLF